MKKTNLMPFLCLLFYLFLSFSQNIICAEDIKGFRGLDWGTPLPSSGMKFEEKDTSYGGVDFYSRDGDSLKIGAADIVYIYYGYWNNKFCGVRILCKGTVNQLAILESFTEKFGKPYQPNKFIKEYAWIGKYTSIMFTYNVINEETAIILGSSDILKEQKEWMKKQAKKGKDDF